MRIAIDWFGMPYPAFKRLALFAASKDDCVSADQWVDWVLSDGAWWLWAANTAREIFRLFILQGAQMSHDPQQRLESAILAGPRRDMFPEELEQERWQEIVDRKVWLHLAKLRSSGLTLGAEAAARLEKLSLAYPQYELASDESDEFSHWMSGTGDPGWQDKREVDNAPLDRSELVEWLIKAVPEQRLFYEDTWRAVCRANFARSFTALCELSRRDEWPIGRWREALQVWAEDGMVLRSWRYGAPLVQAMPDSVLQDLSHAVTWWLGAVSKSICRNESALLELCGRVIELPIEAGQGSRIIRDGVETYDPVGSAINHPIGHVTQALFNVWFKRNPNDNDSLPSDIGPYFTRLCDTSVEAFRHGRVLLASRLISLFRVDKAWTQQYMLGLFDWSDPVEAQSVWEGFLWSPRLYQPLLAALKAQFLDCANHYANLGEHHQQFAAFLTYAALAPLDGYSVEEFRSAIGALPKAGLEESAQALYQALDSSGDQREDYWRNRAYPFWHQIWPKSKDLPTPRISESLSRLAIAAGAAFPEALAAVKGWLLPIEHPHYVLNKLEESGQCTQFPEDALALLNAVITDPQWVPEELGSCLDQIAKVAPHLSRDARYMRLREVARKAI